MPTQTVSFDNEMYDYITDTSDGDGFSKRVRELVRMGMEVESSDLNAVMDELDEETPTIKNTINALAKER